MNDYDKNVTDKEVLLSPPPPPYDFTNAVQQQQQHSPTIIVNNTTVVQVPVPAVPILVEKLDNNCFCGDTPRPVRRVFIR